MSAQENIKACARSRNTGVAFRDPREAGALDGGMYGDIPTSKGTASGSERRRSFLTHRNTASAVSTRLETEYRGMGKVAAVLGIELTLAVR